MKTKRLGLMLLNLALVLSLVLCAGPALAGKPVKPAGDMPKNVILMISDGQGYNTVAATDYFTGQTPIYETPAFTAKYGVSTYPVGGSYDPARAWADFNYVKSGATDSAAAVTAMATGVKTRNGYVGVNSSGVAVKNIVEPAGSCDRRISWCRMAFRTKGSRGGSGILQYPTVMGRHAGVSPGAGRYPGTRDSVSGRE